MESFTPEQGAKPIAARYKYKDEDRIHSNCQDVEELDMFDDIQN